MSGGNVYVLDLEGYDVGGGNATVHATFDGACAASGVRGWERCFTDDQADPPTWRPRDRDPLGTTPVIYRATIRP